MPLIDEETNLTDLVLSNRVKSNFFFGNGIISDVCGNKFILWRRDGFESWWIFFEEIMDSSLGRKLANASCDEEEKLLQNGALDATGFFAKKKQIKLFSDRWELHGWGLPDYSSKLIHNSGLSMAFAGLFQAGFEYIEKQRYKMRWQDINSELIKLDLEKSDISLPIPNGQKNPQIKGENLTLSLESEWKIDGKRYHLIPVGIFSRLLTSCLGYPAQIDSDERNCWPDEQDSFIAMAMASKNLFIRGEELFLAADESGWKSSIEALFSKRGLGEAKKVTFIDNNGGVEIEFVDYSSIPLLLGLLAGAWTRCEGRPVKCEYDLDKGVLTIRLYSKNKIA